VVSSALDNCDDTTPMKGLPELFQAFVISRNIALALNWQMIESWT
jgi:hypothetical protein